MSELEAITGSEIFDGKSCHQHCALIFADQRIVKITDESDIPLGAKVTKLDGGLLAPGFVDLQVNGGGGVLFNDQPDVEAIATICAAHGNFGTTTVFPTLITDSRQITTMAIAAAIEANARAVPGFLGLHLEGPHLSVERKGAHDPAFIRKMDQDDLHQLLVAKQNLPHLMVTLAPEAVSNEQISKLSGAGIIVSLGHTNATHGDACTAIDAGAKCITHLFNAMSPFGHREPGLVGAGLANAHVNAGLIADGYHVDPVAISIALAAKKGPGKIFLVSDAMSTIGTDLTSFTLNERTIFRKQGRLVLEDGTLAGADLELASAIRFMKSVVGVGQYEAIKMASLYPAEVIGASRQYGNLNPGAYANVVHLDQDNYAVNIWCRGRLVTGGDD